MKEGYHILIVVVVIMIIAGASTLLIVDNKEADPIDPIFNEPTKVTVEVPVEQPNQEDPFIQDTPEEEVKEPVQNEELLSKVVTIQIFRKEFDQTEITIVTGTTVIWENKDDRRHMITNPKLGLFRTIRESLELGDTFEYTFNEPGEYLIQEANFGINGNITVVDPKEMPSITGYAVYDLNQKSSAKTIASGISLMAIVTAAVLACVYLKKEM